MSESDKSGNKIESNGTNLDGVTSDLHEELIKEAVKKINKIEDSPARSVYLANHFWLIN